MFEALFYFTGALSVAALAVLLTRHESLGALKSEIEALKAQSAELRQKLKKETENSNHLLRRLTEQYDEAIDREQKKVEEARGLHNQFKEKLAVALRDSENRMKQLSDPAASLFARLETVKPVETMEVDVELSPDDPQNKPR